MNFKDMLNAEINREDTKPAHMVVSGPAREMALDILHVIACHNEEADIKMRTEMAETVNEMRLMIHGAEGYGLPMTADDVKQAAADLHRALTENAEFPLMLPWYGRLTIMRTAQTQSPHMMIATATFIAVMGRVDLNG